MYPGFIPFSRGSLMMDTVLIGMALILPALGYSIYRVRQGSYNTHRIINSVIGSTLLVVVILFEIEVRLFGWRQQAEVSPYFGPALFWVLGIHIFFAVSASIALVLTFWGTFRNFKNINGNYNYPSSYRKSHARLGKITALLLMTTTITGSIFYYMAFIAI